MTLLALHHTGIIVPDLEAAMVELGAALGLKWAAPKVFLGEIRLADGRCAFRKSCITYSIGDGHHIELIQQLDDTAWRGVRGGPFVHHIGLVAEDLEAESSRLEAIGFPREASDGGPSGLPNRMAYHYNRHGGIYIELIAPAVRSDVEAWLVEATDK